MKDIWIERYERYLSQRYDRDFFFFFPPWVALGKSNHCNIIYYMFLFKSPLSRLRQISQTESPLEMIKNAFCFTLKYFFCSQDI